MAFKLPNIYANRNLKHLIAVPIILLVLGLYFSTQIHFDSTLSGGVSILLETNSTISPSQFASMLTSKLGVSEPDVVASPGGYEITITENQSLSNAQNYLISFYQFQANYSSFQFNATTDQIGLEHSPNNETLQMGLEKASAGMNASSGKMAQYLNLELSTLKPLIGQRAYNASDIAGMGVVANNAYTNASTIYQSKVVSALQAIVPFKSYSYQQISPTLSSYFLGQIEYIIVVAFLLISIVVFVIFRSVVPSFSVVFGAGNDIIIALGFMGLLKIPLGLASLGGLLMLIGYSIDTDMLSAVRILKRHDGTAEDRAYSAFRTGTTMTFTAILSFGILFIVSLIAYVPTYYEISGVVLFGLIGDLFTTWLGNTSMILMYKKKKDGR